MRTTKTSSYEPANRVKVLLFVFVSLLILVTSCTTNDIPVEEPILKGKITSYNEFGAAMLDFQEVDMEKAGFTLGDVISITIDDKEIVMPYYDGFYTRNGEYLCVAYPTYPSVCFTANNVGLPPELTGLEGQLWQELHQLCLVLDIPCIEDDAAYRILLVHVFHAVVHRLQFQRHQVGILLPVDGGVERLGANKEQLTHFLT
jgi:hypothetical protein